jgi:hypothetical protein
MMHPSPADEQSQRVFVHPHLAPSGADRRRGQQPVPDFFPAPLTDVSTRTPGLCPIAVVSEPGSDPAVEVFYGGGAVAVGAGFVLVGPTVEAFYLYKYFTRYLVQLSPLDKHGASGGGEGTGRKILQPNTKSCYSTFILYKACSARTYVRQTEWNDGNLVDVRYLLCHS